MSAVDLSGVRDDYRVVLADPPWLYQKAPNAKRGGEPEAGRGGYAEAHYGTLTNEQIAAIPVADHVADDAHLFLWVTNPGLYGGRFSDVTPHDIADAWGFRFQTLLTWVKTAGDGRPHEGGMGWYFRGCTEHVLYATRGKAGIPAERREPNVLMAPRRAHSEKPSALHDMIERVADGPYLELFARVRRPGWDIIGDQADQDETIVRARPLSRRAREEAATYDGSLLDLMGATSTGGSA